MTRVDLDALQRILDQRFTVLRTSVVALDDDTGRQIVAELRAAREVVEAAGAYRGRLSGGGAVEKWAALAAALAAYDEVVGS